MIKRQFNENAKRNMMALVQGVLIILPFDAMARIQYRYERIGEGKFTDIKTPVVTSIPYILTVNIDWYESADEYDVKLMLRHEARHLYQQNQIEKLSLGKPVAEDANMILQWDNEFIPDNYVSNMPGKEREHFTQACEIDAYVFASFICNTETIRDDGSCSLSIVQYPFIGDIVEQRVIHMLHTTPMENLQKYRDLYSRQKV